MKKFILVAAGLSLLGTVLAAPADKAPVFVSQATHNNMLSFIPDGVFTAEEKSRMVFYDDKTTPQAHIHNNFWLSNYYNISASKPAEPFGNANREFPWKTGGLDDSDNGESFKAILLPEPIVVWQEDQLNGYADSATDRVMTGQFPLKTKSIEFLIVDEGKHPDTWKGWHTFEVRILEKVGMTGDVGKDWKPRWFRGVKNSDELMELTKNTPYHDVLVDHYKRKFSITTLADTNHTTHVVINVERAVDDLPKATPEILAKVHNRKFKEVTDEVWLESKSGYKAYAAAGGVFPNNYQGTHFGSKECLACHATAGKHTNDFQMSRDWYGRVRGFDGIFSLPLCDESCVSHNGIYVTPTWSQKLKSAGMIKEWTGK